jgi:ubiquinone/menaquinone biosynthesis C-methylase UbiE
VYYYKEPEQPAMSYQENTPHIFERNYYQRLYEIEEQHGWAQGLRAAMVALLRKPLAGTAPLRVLDIGCGTGYLLEDLKRYPLDGEPVGIDLSSHALEFCRQRGASALALASGLQTPFSAASFDLIVCIDTLQHLTPTGADRMALTEFARLLRPGGLLYLRTNSARGHVPLTGVDPDQYRRYNLDTVAKLLLDVGFTVERATYVNAIPGAWAMLREVIRSRRQPSAAIGPGLAIRPYPPRLAWLNRLMYCILAFEAWLIGTLQLSLPFGHSTVFIARQRR